jgi:hypothetical protein
MTDDEISIAKLVSTALKIRDARRAASKEWKAKDSKLESQFTTVMNHLLDFCNRTGQKSIPTEAATAYKAKRTMASCKDWDAFYKFVVEEGAFHFLHKRLTTAEVEKYGTTHRDKDGNPIYPPGVRVEHAWEMRLRVAGEKDDDD